MIRRRQFLQSALAGTATGLGAAASIPAPQPDHISGTQSSGPSAAVRLEGLVNESEIRPRGELYEAKVPDTLDLAERAELILNALLGEVDPAHDYSSVRFRFDTNPVVRNNSVRPDSHL